MTKAPRRQDKFKDKLDQYKYWVDDGIDFENRCLSLVGDIDDDSCTPIIRAIKLLETLGDDPIHIHINSVGGDIYAGLALYDVMRSSKAPIYTYGNGTIMSMATWILLAGDRRFAYPSTTFMWHTLSGGTDGRLFELVTDTEEAKRLWEVLLNIYEERTVKTAAYYRKWLKYVDQYGDAVLAKELNFIHEIIGETND